MHHNRFSGLRLVYPHLHGLFDEFDTALDTIVTLEKEIAVLRGLLTGLVGACACPLSCEYQEQHPELSRILSGESYEK